MTTGHAANPRQDATDPAVTAADTALHDHFCLDGRRCPSRASHDEWVDAATIAVAAARPIIEAEVRAEEAAKAIDAEHLAHQREWSRATFGPGTRLLGVLDHIRKELAEIEADPTDLVEWVDVLILAFDGAWRAGWEPEQIIAAVKAKQARNEARTWPDWRGRSEDEAIEHDRTTDVARIARGKA